MHAPRWSENRAVDGQVFATFLTAGWMKRTDAGLQLTTLPPPRTPIIAT
jgi:hypothetical protein